jgi:hypothetical protein
MHDVALSENIIRLFGVDVLLPVLPSEATSSFIGSYRHLRYKMFQDGIFYGRRCEFADIRHALVRFARRLHDGGEMPSAMELPEWSPVDPLAHVFGLMLGNYPSPDEIGIDYCLSVERNMVLNRCSIEGTNPLTSDWLDRLTPLGLTVFDLPYRRSHSSWTRAGVVLGSADNFDDLLLFWNLKASGAWTVFYDIKHSTRLKPFVQDFLTSFRPSSSAAGGEVALWSRPAGARPVSPPSELDVTGLRLLLCSGDSDGLWNGYNIRPVAPQFSLSHRDVVPSFFEEDGRAFASFPLPERPFDDESHSTSNQRFVVTVDAKQYGSVSDGLTFTTPFVPKLNEFYGRKFYVESDKARSEPGNLGFGAVGLLTTVQTQMLQVNAIKTSHWMRAFFEQFGVSAQPSEPGLRCTRLIRQLGGFLGCRVLKVTGARELIRRHGPDQSFTRSAAEKCIGNYDSVAKRMRFEEFEDLYIQPRESGKLSPSEVLQYMTARDIFRVGLEFHCPNCALASWLHLDEVKTVSTCTYCGCHFNVTPQLEDRDWRYRRSGLFGRDDHQLGSIPVALALQQLATALHDDFLMYSTALEFTPKAGVSAIEKCEVDFVVAAGGHVDRTEAKIQILFGEAKTAAPFNEQDVRKLGKLADAVPRDMADAYIMFAKTESFTADEIALARTMNSKYRQRVILWSRNELEPYYVYERSAAKLGNLMYAVGLTDMAQATHQLWFADSTVANGVAG